MHENRNGTDWDVETRINPLLPVLPSSTGGSGNTNPCPVGATVDNDCVGFGDPFTSLKQIRYCFILVNVNRYYVKIVNLCYWIKILN